MTPQKKDNQAQLVIKFGQSDAQEIKELLLFMKSKNWLVPTTDIEQFLEGAEKDKNDFPNEPPPQNKDDSDAGNNILNPENYFLVSVNKAIEEHLDDEDFRPRHLSKKIFLCEMQLYRKLKKLANLSPSNYIRKYRLLRSLDYLNEVHLSVSEVCYRVGFRSLEYYSRSFKKEFGVCPSEYKSRCWNSSI